MIPPYFHQATTWIELLKEFGWNSTNIIHSFDNEGNMISSRFNYLADLNNINVSKISTSKKNNLPF